MTDASGETTHTPRVFISYSHDSPEHEARVHALADRLREEDGVDCEMDQYEEAPPEGWPRWMYRQVQEADYVVVACTETYQRRAEGGESPGRGLGATWEGAVVITQEIYEAQGRNEKFIPVHFGDESFIPYYLRPTTRYDVSTEKGYDALVRRLTRRPAVRRPALGNRRPLAEPTAPARTGSAPPRNRATKKAAKSAAEQHLLLLEITAEGAPRLFTAERIVVAERITAVLRPSSSTDSAFLSSLRDRSSRRLAVAYHEAAVVARVISATQRLDATGEAWDLVLEPEPPSGGFGTEVATTGHSTDDIAEMRARRILLNERLEEGSERGWGRDGMLDALVRGMGRPFQVVRSPFPDLYAAMGEDERRFLAAARLTAVLWLRLTGTVDHIVRLELELDDGGRNLSVVFQGRRPRYYTNVEPTTMSVRGACRLA